MKVRAKADGHYNGYYREGPKENAEGGIEPGEVFEIDAKPHAFRDEQGNPMQETQQTGELNANGTPMVKPVWMLDKDGKPKKGEDGNLLPKIKMATFFDPEWMEPVNEDATVTYPDRSKPFGILPQMRPAAAQRTSVAARPVKLPDDIAKVVAEASQSESPI